MSPRLESQLPERIAEALRHIAKGDQGDEVRLLNDPAFMIGAGLVHEAAALSDQLIPAEQERVVVRSLLYMCRQDQTTVDHFYARARAMQSEILGARPRLFHILAYATGKVPNPGPNNILLETQVSEVAVRLVRKYPATADTTTWDLGGGYGPVALLPQGVPYVPIWASVDARSEEHAAFLAISAIQTALGCLNFCLNRGSRRYQSGPNLPVNQLRLAGEQVVYQSDWSRYEERIHYEEIVRRDPWPIDVEKKLEEGRPAIRRAFGRLSDPIFGPLLREAFQDYQEALTYTDQALVLARLWGLLERLTDSRPGEPTTVRRASFLSNLAIYRRRTLSLSANARHAFVHRRERKPFISELSHDLRMWADFMLAFLCFTRRKFTDLDSFYRLLDAPISVPEIERQLRIYQMAKSIRRR